MRRLTALFLDADWAADAAAELRRRRGVRTRSSASTQIPARARYQYMLDDAQYFVMTFIRGPVCRGQVAVDVIEDHFFVAFLDPDHDLSVTDPSFLPRAAGVPATARRAPEPSGARRVLGRSTAIEQRRYLDLRAQYYDAARSAAAAARRSTTSGTATATTRNAQLTVFRHFDNATVVRGFLGAMPKTAWVMDYPLFERIYYDLVAGYDVFGSVAHQVATRLYMDHLRMQSRESLPHLPARRPARGHPRLLVRRRDRHARLRPRRPPARHLARDAIPFRPATRRPSCSDDALARNPQVAGPPDLLNRCAAPPCDRPGASPLERRAERALQPLTGVRGAVGRELPEVRLPARARRQRRRGPTRSTRWCTTARTPTSPSCSTRRARLEPADDTLTVARGYLGSYPNFIFDGRRVADRDVRAGARRGARRRPTSPRSSSAGACAAPARACGRRSTGCTTTSAAAADRVRPLRSRPLRELLIASAIATPPWRAQGPPLRRALVRRASARGTRGGRCGRTAMTRGRGSTSASRTSRPAPRGRARPARRP